ncbi:MAG: glycosyltransferase [Candidatus Micrarchaeaceae archaeon]
MEIWIVIPAYNEEKRIAPTLDDYLNSVVKKYTDTHILVVSDSTDNTNKIVSSYSSKYKSISLIKNSKRKGKGFAILTGFKYAYKVSKNESIIGFADADDAIPGSELIKMLDEIKDSKLDGAIASRYVNGSINEGNIGVQRIVASRVYNKLLKFLFGFKFNDTQCGAKLFKKKALENVLSKLILMDVSFDLNLLYELKIENKKIEEIPIRYVNKGNSSMKIKLGLRGANMFFVAIGFRIIRSRFSFIIPAGLRSKLYKLIANW